MPTNQRITSSTRDSCTALRRVGLVKLIISALILLAAIENSNAIKCFKCAVTVDKYQFKNTTIIVPMCSKFDESDEYIVDCQFSTMCLKTISTLHLQNGQKLDTITRGCAPQKDTTQVFRNHEWQQQHSVQEVYQEGCGEFKENNLAGSVKTHCYCRGNLCNSATRYGSKSLMCIKSVAVIMLINVLFSFLKS